MVEPMASASPGSTGAGRRASSGRSRKRVPIGAAQILDLQRAPAVDAQAGVAARGQGIADRHLDVPPAPDDHLALRRQAPPLEDPLAHHQQLVAARRRLAGPSLLKGAGRGHRPAIIGAPGTVTSR
jgi:hypothetical protein